MCSKIFDLMKFRFMFPQMEYIIWTKLWKEKMCNTKQINQQVREIQRKIVWQTETLLIIWIKRIDVFFLQ